MKKKIIIGSANFNQIYGIKKNFIKSKEINKLLNFAQKNKIKKIDTSPAYNKSEKIIGLFSKKKIKVISKIPQLPKNLKKNQIKNWVTQSITKSLENLKVKKFECILLQDAEVLLSKNGKEIYKCMKNIKNKKLTNKIGISIYEFNKLKKIFSKFQFDTVQVPFNILDQRLVTTGWLKKFKKKNIEVHARSIFLQGLLLLRSKQLPKKLNYLKKHWVIWENWLKKNKFNPLQVCLSFVLKYKNLDGVIVGQNNLEQFKQIIKLRLIKKNFILPNLKIPNRKLIDPRQWNKR